MPLYEYECPACEHRFDRLASVADADEAACPRCGTARARRLLSVIAGLGGRADAGLPQPSRGDLPAPACGAGGCAHCS